MPGSVGERIYEVRRALGADSRTELPLRAFAKLLEAHTGRPWYSIELSRMERNLRGVSLEEIDAIAFLDPDRRGREWLAWGSSPVGSVSAATPGAPSVAEPPVVQRQPVIRIAPPAAEKSAKRRKGRAS
jgi:hypothetical protein